MNTNTNIENTPRVITLTLAIWALSVAAGSVAGVFGKLPLEEVVAIGVFGFGFGLASAYLDEGIRKLIVAAPGGTLATIAIEVNLAIILAALLAAGFSEGAVAPVLRDLLASFAMLFLAPIAGVLHVVIAERLLKPRAARPYPVAKRRGATPAAPGRQLTG